MTWQKRLYDQMAKLGFITCLVLGIPTLIVAVIVLVVLGYLLFWAIVIAPFVFLAYKFIHWIAINIGYEMRDDDCQNTQNR